MVIKMSKKGGGLSEKALLKKQVSSIFLVGGAESNPKVLLFYNCSSIEVFDLQRVNLYV